MAQYMIEIWKAAGMDMTRVEFLNASDEINKRPNEYWTLVMDIARQNTLARITKCCQIMGRSESDNLSASQIFYPCMQCADIFFLKVGRLLIESSCIQASGHPCNIQSLYIFRNCVAVVPALKVQWDVEPRASALNHFHMQQIHANIYIQKYVCIYLLHVEVQFCCVSWEAS